MSFLYFAYGSNLWPKQMVRRCPSARLVERAALGGWAPRYDKPSADGSAKLNIVEEQGGEVQGVVYEVSDGERPALDAAEPGYDAIDVEVRTETGRPARALTYQWTGERAGSPPYRWYVAMAQLGARQHGIPAAYWGNHLSAEAVADPLAGNMRPASEEDLPVMQAILSQALEADDGRDSPHPGDLAWWIWHADPRHSEHHSYWIEEDRAVLFLDSGDGGEVRVFAVPGVSRTPLVQWGFNRLHGRGELGFVADADRELVRFAEESGFGPVGVYRLYRWDLAHRPIPEPSLPDGWVIRPVAGEHEADNRRRASHAAFKSTMDESAHHQRYLRFMRSPVYDAERDLVAITPDGRIASFIIWWPDSAGIAQIEPFGTHPDFQRRGVGRALMYHALRRMREEGMAVARVTTDEPREDAMGFYEGIGFETVGKSRSWADKSPAE